MGHTTIGLATPVVVVEYGRYDHGGFGGGSAVAIRPVDDLATIFIDWRLNWEVFAQLWEGDSLPFSPSVKLFAAAAANPDRMGHWGSEEYDEDEGDEDEDEMSHRAASYLKLDLSDELIDQIRVRLRTLDPEYAEIIEGVAYPEAAALGRNSSHHVRPALGDLRVDGATTAIERLLGARLEADGIQDSGPSAVADNGPPSLTWSA